MKSIFLVLFLSFLASIYGLVTFSVQGKVNLPEPTIERLREITVSLESTGKIEYLNKDGIFVFTGIEPGFYIAHVNDNLYTYEPIFVEVTKKEVKAYEYSYQKGKGLKHKYPFEINPIAPIKYLEDSPSMLSSLIKNPYVLMIGLPLVFFGLTKLVPQEDLKAQSEEFNKQFKSMKNNFGFFK